MSAFAVIYEPSNKPTNPAMLERMMMRLSHRGPDGSNSLSTSHTAMGHWHFWATPEDIGEKQPLQLSGTRFKIVFDGRLDNRVDLLASLDCDQEKGNQLSDAALALYAYARWGENCVEHFTGVFAFVILDEEKKQLFCARDPLGDRTLFYAFQGTRVIIASEPWAVAGAHDIEPKFNDSAIAHYFALKATEDGQSLFDGIFELLPAHLMLINASGKKKRPYWKPDFTTKIRYKKDEEYAEHFLSLLRESIQSRIRSSAPIGILMSGGLDSTSVACLAAAMVAPQKLTTLSYVFDELSDCDERIYINAVREQYKTQSIQILCDDTAPYTNWKTWPHNPNFPEGNPYRLMKERTYKRAQTEGIRVLLTGGFGDTFYKANNDWLIDSIIDKKFLEAGQELKYHIQRDGVSKALTAGYMRQLVKRTLFASFGKNIFPLRKTSPWWLTDFSNRHLSDVKKNNYYPAERHHLFVDLRASFGTAAEIFNASRHNLELRHPYRDIRLISFIMQIPAYQLYRRGIYKHILRIAMKDILPEIIRTRPHPTVLTSLFLRGHEQEKTLFKGYLETQVAGFKKFVETEQILSRFDEFDKSQNISTKTLIPFFSVSYEAWYRSRLVASKGEIYQ